MNTLADRPAGEITVVHRRQTRLRCTGFLAIYLVIASIYTWPLLPQSGDRIANDPYDPILNTSILWWNATTIPFSPTWWNPPYFYPSDDISAFTENLQGITPISTPVFWITRNPLTTYNIAVFLTYPLGAFGAFLIVRMLTARDDAAFLAGLSFGFTPFRTAELGHLQMISAYWIPLAILGLHGYLNTHRPVWLVLFGATWILQSLANGYLMFYGGVLIGMWILYFCSTPRTWRAGRAITTSWVMATIPLVPILMKYRSVHEHYGLRREIYHVAPFEAWLQVKQNIWFWRRFLPDGDALFPGLTVLVLVIVAALVRLRWRRTGDDARKRRLVRVTLGGLTVLGLAATVFLAIAGPTRYTILGVPVRMTSLRRPLGVMIISGVAWFLMRPDLRARWKRRSPLLFYGGATAVLGVFSCGPELRSGGHVLLSSAPYSWLLHVPGFTSLRIPDRFWILGVLCLAVAAGLSFASLLRPKHRARTVILAMATAGILLDGWMAGFPLAVPPRLWPTVEQRDQTRPILELPLGPEWDAAATFRSIWHRRRVVNGVSGYDPAHYAPLQSGLNDHDPAILQALASLGAYDIVVNSAADPGGELARYAMTAPGVQPLNGDGTRLAFRVPEAANPDVAVGPVLPIMSARAFLRDGSAIIDRRLETGWGDGPQRPGQWVLVDLGVVREVGGVTHAMGEYAHDFPRRLAIDVSEDGESWEQVWEGPTAALAFLAAIRGPREAAMHFTFPAQPARYVRLRQVAEHNNLWRVSELAVHAPLNQ
jgi:F5/8 type C domain